MGEEAGGKERGREGLGWKFGGLFTLFQEI